MIVEPIAHISYSYMVDGINNSPAVSLERFDLSQLRVRGAVRIFRKRVYLPRRYVVVFHVYEV